MLNICCFLGEYNSTEEWRGEIFKKRMIFTDLFEQCLYVLFVFNVVALMMYFKTRIFLHVHIDHRYFFGKNFSLEGQSDVLLANLSHFIDFLFQLLRIRQFCKSSPTQKANSGLNGISFQVGALPPLLLHCLLPSIDKLRNAAGAGKLVLCAKLKELLIAVLSVEGESIVWHAKRRRHGVFECSM